MSVPMMGRLMVAGSANRSWQDCLLRSTQIAIGLALLALLLVFLLSLVFPEGPGAVAGAALFQNGLTARVWLVALVWAPGFETVVGQLLPIALVRLFSRSRVLAIVCSGLVFGLGHMAGGGGPIQGLMSAVIGAGFAFVFLTSIEFGHWRATLATAWAHCLYNALILLASLAFG